MFGSYTRGVTGEGMIALYPFSSWLFLLNLPDRIRINRAALELLEAGLSGGRTWSLQRRLHIHTGLTMSGCRVDGNMATQHLVRYAGLIPVYEDERMQSINEDWYMVINGLLEFRKQAYGHAFNLSVRQLLPVPLGGRKRRSLVTGGPETNDVSFKFNRYGGLSVAIGMDIGDR